MQKVKIERISTGDGSDSLYLEELDETYHSRHGAIQESRHVFVRNGLEHYNERHRLESLKVLEFGFGTGLNALLTLENKENVKISYLSLEKYPLELSQAVKLNYGEKLAQRELFKKLHECPWNSWQNITENFKLYKHQIDFRDFIPKESFDLIYFDAFAPDKQPDLWSVNILTKCSEALKINGVFVTYSAKGQLRRDLQKLNFTVERLPGPPGKHEMIRAKKN